MSIAIDFYEVKNLNPLDKKLSDILAAMLLRKLNASSNFIRDIDVVDENFLGELKINLFVENAPMLEDEVASLVTKGDKNCFYLGKNFIFVDRFYVWTIIQELFLLQFRNLTYQCGDKDGFKRNIEDVRYTTSKIQELENLMKEFSVVKELAESMRLVIAVGID